jgi:hypothetical protein
MAHRDEHIIIFEHRDFRGRHRHIFGHEENLNNAEGNTLNDRISSFVVLSGTWVFLRHANFNEQVGGTFPQDNMSLSVILGFRTMPFHPSEPSDRLWAKLPSVGHKELQCSSVDC